MRRMMIGVLSVVAAVVLFLELCTYKVRPYEVAIVDRFGKVVAQPTRLCYGWYIKWPTDRVTALDTRLHLYPSLLQQEPTKGGDSISVRAFAAWRIQGDGVLFYKTFKGSDKSAEQTMSLKLSGATGTVFGQHTLDQLFNMDESKLKTEEMESQVKDLVNNGNPGEPGSGMKALGIEVEHVGFSRLSFPPMVAEAVYRRMVAERLKQAAGYESQGLAEAAKIRAEGDQQASDIKAAAERLAQQIRGEGDKEALRILQSLQTPDAQAFYQFWREMELFKAGFKNPYLVWRSGEPLTDLLQTHHEQGLGGAATQPKK